MTHRVFRQLNRRPYVGAIGFAAGNYLQTANPGGEAGVGTGFGVWLMFRPVTQAGGATQIIFDRAAAGQGFAFYTAVGNTSLLFGVNDGVGAFINSPSYTLTASHVGKTILACGLHSGSRVKLYVETEVAAPGTAVTGYTATSAQTCIGGRRGTFPSDGCEVFGAVTFSGTLTATQIADAFEKARLINAIPPIPGETHRWDMMRNPPPASLLDQTGTDHMTAVGSLSTSSSMDVALV